MKTSIKELNDKKMLDQIIAHADKPTIICIARKYSFGAHWLGRILKKVVLKYEDQIIIHAYYLEEPAKIMSLLGEGNSLITYFIKDKEIKSRVTGSVAKSTFDRKLSTIIC